MESCELPPAPAPVITEDVATHIAVWRNQEVRDAKTVVDSGTQTDLRDSDILTAYMSATMASEETDASPPTVHLHAGTQSDGSEQIHIAREVQTIDTSCQGGSMVLQEAQCVSIQELNPSCPAANVAAAQPPRLPPALEMGVQSRGDFSGPDARRPVRIDSRPLAILQRPLTAATSSIGSSESLYGGIASGASIHLDPSSGDGRRPSRYLIRRSKIFSSMLPL